MGFDIIKEALELENWMVGVRRKLHQNPEVGMELPTTAKIVKETLDELGVSYEEFFPHCIKAIIGKGDKAVLLRADIDALPIVENTGLDFASANGAMHACGHDTHGTMLLGAAALLKKHEDELTGKVILVFQPGEEGCGGARVMLEHGILNDNPVYAAAMHIYPSSTIETGTAAVPLGTTHASSDRFVLKLTGRGTHGSQPHEGINPIICAAKIIDMLSEITSYGVDAMQPCVVTVNVIHAGSAANITPETCEVMGTFRTLDVNVREFIMGRIKTIIANVTAAYGVKYDLTFGGGYPPQKNNDDFARALQKSFEENLPGLKILPQGTYTSLGGEDFAFISQKVPGCYMLIHSHAPEGQYYPLHNEKVVLDEHAMPFGSAMYVQTAFTALEL